DALEARKPCCCLYARRLDFSRDQITEAGGGYPGQGQGGQKFSTYCRVNSQSATGWQKDGSLVVEIENMVDGEDGSITATRTVMLGFDRSDKAKILKSTVKFETSHD